MKRSAIVLVLVLFCSVSASAGDLYKVTVGSAADTKRLSMCDVDPVVRVADGFLVIAGSESVRQMQIGGLEFTLVAPDVDRSRLALDARRDRKNVGRYSLLYEEGALRLFVVDPGTLSTEAEVFPIGSTAPAITWREPARLAPPTAAEIVDLNTLIAGVQQSSLTMYTTQLQSYYRRLAGTPANNLARDWLYDRFVSFGYDSVVIDTFVASLNGTPTECHNVLAYKIGTRFPNHQVIVGAHRDGVWNSPAADDNGSGTAGVLEVARVLKDVETDMTIIFSLYDAEEFGLYGSYHYVDEAYARGDSIVYMLNMDMIAHYENTTQAALYHGTDVTFSNLWIHLADSLLGITGHLSGNSSGSDHYPFTQRGYPATFAAEYIFSTVYHSPRDSMTYMSFPYMTKMVKASLATAYMVSQTAGPQPILIFEYPAGAPSMLAPAAPTTFAVNVSGAWGGVPIPGTGMLHYSLDGGAYTALAMIELSPGHYEATLPPGECLARYRFYVSADESQTGTIENPSVDNPFTAIVATEQTTTFADNFETDLEWTVSSTATAGRWERGVPAGGGVRGDPPTDYDGSGQCYLTGNTYGDSDVDGGTTYLTSPAFDLSEGVPVVSYARWYSNSFGSSPNSDYFRVYVSNSNGSAWTLVETVGPVVQASGGWYTHSFFVSDFVGPNNQVRVRFEAADLGAGSVVEAGVDAFSIRTYRCQSEADWDNDGILNESDNCPFAYNPLQENNDGDGMGNACDPCDCTGMCDLNLDAAINPLDVVTIVNLVYKSVDQRQPLPTVCPRENGDWNGDGQVNPIDVVAYVNKVYKETGPSPYNPCGP